MEISGKGERRHQTWTTVLAGLFVLAGAVITILPRFIDREADQDNTLNLAMKPVMGFEKQGREFASVLPGRGYVLLRVINRSGQDYTLKSASLEIEEIRNATVKQEEKFDWDNLLLGLGAESFKSNNSLVATIKIADATEGLTVGGKFSRGDVEPVLQSAEDTHLCVYLQDDYEGPTTPREVVGTIVLHAEEGTFEIPRVKVVLGKEQGG